MLQGMIRPLSSAVQSPCGMLQPLTLSRAVRFSEPIVRRFQAGQHRLQRQFRSAAAERTLGRTDILFGVCASGAIVLGRRRGLHGTIGGRGCTVRGSRTVVAKAAAGSELVDPSSVEQPGAPVVGTYATIRSSVPAIRKFVPVAALGASDGPAIGSRVWVRARLATVRVKGKSTFVVLRQHSLHTVQAVKFKGSKSGGNSTAASSDVGAEMAMALAEQDWEAVEMLQKKHGSADVPDSSEAVAKFFKTQTLESVVDVCGVLVESNVASCTQSNVELQIERAYLVSAAAATLPFLFADAQRSEADVKASLGTDRPYVRVLPDLRLDYRWLDLRVPAHNSIMRVQAAVCRLFRDSLTARGFVEIHSPKLLGGESEGGAEVFRTDYFGKSATLAQSPQIYKQMALSADMPGVFEIGPVFRAENSNTGRHLCEFTGLDFEMPIDWHYYEVLTVVHDTLKGMFNALEEEHADILKIIRAMYPSTKPQIPQGSPCIVPWGEAMTMLKDKGFDRDVMEDLSTEEEKALGALVLEKHGADLFFLDRYPSKVRPFYTMPCVDAPEFSNSYDLIFRGAEIGSGAQRCHEPALLEARCAELGVPIEPLQPYIDSFRHGVPPHGGIGLGLERIVQLYLGLDNIRKASLFVRDPARLSP